MEVNSTGMHYQTNFPLGFAPAEPAATQQTATTIQFNESCRPGCTFQRRWSLLNELRQRHEYCDLMLVSSDKVTFQAHSIVLASSSSFLHTAIQTLRSESYSTSGPQKLSIDGVGSDVLGIVLDCLYGVMPSTLEGMLKLRMGAEALGLNTYFWTESGSKTVTIEQTTETQQITPKSEKQMGQFVEDETDEVNGTARTSDGLPLALAGTSKQRQDKTIATDGEDDDDIVILKMDTEDEEKGSEADVSKVDFNVQGNMESPDIDVKLNVTPVVQIEMMDQLNKSSKSDYENSEQSINDTQNTPSEIEDSSLKEQEVFTEYIDFDDEFEGVIVKQEDEYFETVYQEDGTNIFKCLECDASANDEESITKHSLIEHKNYIECHLCNCVAENTEILERHIGDEHYTASFYKYCKKCDLQFTSHDSYLEHKDIHKEAIKDPICNKCGKKFSGMANLRRHEIVIHAAGDEQPSVCQMCGKSFKCGLYLNDHIRIAHATSMKFECDCGRCYKNLKSYTKHRETCEVVIHRLFGKSDEPQNLIIEGNVSEVDVSGVVEDVALRKELGRKMEMNIPDDDLGITSLQEDRMKKFGVKSFSTPFLAEDKSIGYRCVSCPYKSKHHSTVQRHYLLAHNNHVRCVTCSSVFETQELLDAHVAKKHTRIYICTDCDEQFFSFDSLRCHKRRTHGIFNMECRDCKIKFDSLEAYEEHLDLVHEIMYTGKPICKYCNAYFSSVRNLRKHVLCLHSVSKCICDLCGKVYKNKYYLNDHKRTSHRDDRLQCACGKTLKTQISYDRHAGACKMNKLNLKGHHDVLIMCNVCGKTFTCKNYLHKHMLRAHPETITRCKCGRRFKNVEAFEKHTSGCLLYKQD